MGKKLTEIAAKLLEVCENKEDFIELIKLFADALRTQANTLVGEIQPVLEELEDYVINGEYIPDWEKVWDESEK